MLMVRNKRRVRGADPNHGDSSANDRIDFATFNTMMDKGQFDGIPPPETIKEYLKVFDLDHDGAFVF